MRVASALLLVASVMYGESAAADSGDGTSLTAIADPEEAVRIARELERSPPPPSRTVYFQYGVAFTSESVVSAGAMCHDVSKPCILGSGGGIIVRGGWRSSGPLYLGAAYELTKQDPDKLYRMATLQQARGEIRYYLPTHRVAEPYVSGSIGAVTYGNEWGIDTYGAAESVGGGIEYQLSQRTVVGLAVGYRLAYFTRFDDTSGTARDASIAQLFGVDSVLEQRDGFLTPDTSR